MQILVGLYDKVALHSLHLQGYQSRFVDTREGKVHLLDARGGGSLPPLVMLHGLSSQGAHFFPVVKHLRSKVKRIILPDMPAHGLSPSPRVPTAKALERGILEALDAIIDEPVVLFGLSMGGFAATRYAALRRERVRGLILCSPGGASMDEDELDRLRETFRLRDYESALSFVDRLFTKPSLLRHAYAWGVSKSFARPEVKSLVASIDREDLLQAEELASLRVPTKLIWGKRDRILPASSLEFWKNNLPAHAEVVEPETFGHSAFMEEPEKVAQSILDFIEHLPAHRHLEAVQPAASRPGTASTSSPAAPAITDSEEAITKTAA